MARETPPRFRYAVAALLGVLLLGGCGDDDEEPASMGPTDPADPEVTAPRPDADAHMTAVADDEAVRVTWRLDNTGTTPLLVVNRVPVPSGAATDWRADTAYVTGEGNGVLLSQRLFTWPDTDKTWEVSPRAGVTEVPAGESLTQEVVVRLPLERRHPFGPDLGDGVVTLPTDPDSVRFCLGVIAPPYPPALARKRVDGVDTVNHGNLPWARQYLYCSETAALDGSAGH